MTKEKEYPHLYKIERGIPLPPPLRSTKPYPFADMEVREFFTFPLEKLSAVKSARATFYKRNGKKKKFVFRIVASAITQGKRMGRMWRGE